MNKQITVFAGCLVKDNKVLMVQRKEKECPDADMKWEFPGGKVEFGETPEEALEREFREETGVVIKVKSLLPFVQTIYWNYSWGVQQTLCFIYHCEFVREEPRLKDHHVNAVKWYSFEEAIKVPSLPGTEKILNLVAIITL